MNISTEERIQKALSLRSSQDYKNFDCIGTYDKNILSQFVKKHRDRLSTIERPSYLILLFIDKDSYDFDIEEWRSFNNYYQEFWDLGARIIGVSTIKDAELTKLFRDCNLRTKFPVIMDTSRRPLSQSFGFYYSLKGLIGPRILKNCQDLPHNKAKAIAVFDDKNDLFWMQMRLNSSITDPENLYFTMISWGVEFGLIDEY